MLTDVPTDVPTDMLAAVGAPVDAVDRTDETPDPVVDAVDARGAGAITTVNIMIYPLSPEPGGPTARVTLNIPCGVPRGAVPVKT